MKRPPIEEYKEYINNHCFSKGLEDRLFCEDWGCQQVKELIDYIEFLEESNKEKYSLESYWTCPRCGLICVKEHACEGCGLFKND
jgi:hypothetical protein